MPPSCPLDEFVSLDMVTLPNGEFEVPVTFNGRALPLVVDTGSVHISITAEAADELGLKRQLTFNGGSFVNNIAINQLAKIDDLRIGPLRSANGWNVTVIPNNMIPVTEFGLLGPDFVADDDVEFDFFRGKFNIFRHNGCAGNVVYWTHDPYAALPIDSDASHHIKVRASLDGQAVTVGIDTGATTSTMSLEAARAMFGWSNNDPRVKQTGIVNINGGSATSLYSVAFGWLNFDGVTVYNPQITLIPQAHFMRTNGGEPDIILGMSVLRQLHLYVDYQGKMLYLTSAEAH